MLEPAGDKADGVALFNSRRSRCASSHAWDPRHWGTAQSI